MSEAQTFADAGEHCQKSYGTFSDWYVLADGRRFRVKTECDVDSDPFRDDPDLYGNVEDASGRNDQGRGTRPFHFDGSARKFRSRSGMVWWQPPADVVKDAEQLATIAARVRDYFLEDWSYVGVVLEVEHPACACCGERKSDGASLWAVESDSDAESFAEIIKNLMADLPAPAIPTKAGAE